jgi:retron-type reverse transcriptase
MEDWQYHETLSGTPQGGVVSPVLSNIYLALLMFLWVLFMVVRVVVGRARRG